MENTTPASATAERELLVPDPDITQKLAGALGFILSEGEAGMPDATRAAAQKILDEYRAQPSRSPSDCLSNRNAPSEGGQGESYEARIARLVCSCTRPDSRACAGERGESGYACACECHHAAAPTAPAQDERIPEGIALDSLDDETWLRCIRAGLAAVGHPEFMEPAQAASAEAPNLEPDEYRNGTAMCPMCGRVGCHTHQPEEVIIYRNGVKYGRQLGAPLAPVDRPQPEVTDAMVNAAAKVLCGTLTLYRGDILTTHTRHALEAALAARAPKMLTGEK